MNSNLRFVLILFIGLITIRGYGQAPIVTYNGPQTYVQGATISPLTPTTNGGAAVAYSNFTSIGSGFYDPNGVAVDAAGNVYVADQLNHQVKEIPAGGGSTIVLSSSFSAPGAIAVDTAGNVYVTDVDYESITKISKNGASSVLTVGVISDGIAVDNSGNVYFINETIKSLEEIPAYGSNPFIVESGFGTPFGVALDPLGNIYVTDYQKDELVKIPAKNGTPIHIPLAGTIVSPTALAIDALSNIYIVDAVVSAVYKLYPGGKYPVYKAGYGLYQPESVAVDATGNVYIADSGDSQVKKTELVGGYFINPALPAGLSIDNNTGVISGAPIAASPPVNYTIWAYNTSGRTSTGLNISIMAQNSLSCLAVNKGGLTPAFTSTVVAYSDAVSNTTTSIILTPTAADPDAIITVDGNVVESGSHTAAIDLGVGTNDIVITVTVGNAIAQTYTLNVVRASSANANLATLGQSTVGLTPSFTPDVTIYTDNVSNTTASITLKPVSSDANATIKVNGTALASGTTSPPIALDIGQNTISILVTAQNGTTTNTYTINVYKGSTNSVLSNLVLSSGTLSPVFKYTTIGYTANVTNGVSAVTIKPTAADAMATITVNGIIVTSGTGSATIPLAVGANTITTVVTAQNGLATTTYITTVTRAPSSVANLSGLTVNNGALSPAFAPGTYGYTDKVGATAASIKITPTATDPMATIKVNGITVASGAASQAITLSIGQNTITVGVTAQDGTTTGTYIINVYKGSANAALSNLALRSGTLSPVFKYTTTVYTASVANSVSTITVKPTAADATATIKVNGTTIISGTSSGAIALSTGANTITTMVTAQNGLVINTYTIVVYKGATNAVLSNLVLSGGTAISPAFNYQTTGYTANVLNTVASIAVTPTAADANVVITVNGTTVASRSASEPIELAVGVDTITTIVTAQNGYTTDTYIILITRAPGVNDAYAQGISIINPTESPSFDDDVLIVHKGISPNGDGIDDYLVIDGILAYPNNKLTIMNRNGQLIYETQGYDNTSRVFDGHSSKNGQMQLPGTYFYQLDYTVSGITKHKTGFLVLKY